MSIEALKQRLGMAQPNRGSIGFQEALAQPEQIMQDSTCSTTLRLQGKPYPRTCKKCGLGPCIAQPSAQPEQEPWLLDRTGMTYYKNDKCKALNAANHDCICWTPSAQPAQQEPVQFKCTVIDDAHPNGIPLEQWAKPQRKPLTDDELSDLWFKQSTDWMEFARAIEAAHNIKE